MLVPPVHDQGNSAVTHSLCSTPGSDLNRGAELLPSTGDHLENGWSEPHRVRPSVRTSDRRPTPRRRDRRASLQRTIVRARRARPPHRLEPIRQPPVRRRVWANRNAARRRSAHRPTRTSPCRPGRSQERMGPCFLCASKRHHRPHRHSPTVLKSGTVNATKGPRYTTGAFTLWMLRDV